MTTVPVLVLWALASRAVVTDDRIADLVRRVDLLASRESAGPRAETLDRAAALLQAVSPEISRRYADQARRLSRPPVSAEADGGPVDPARIGKAPVSADADGGSADEKGRLNRPPLSPEADRGTVDPTRRGRSPVSLEADRSPVDPARLSRPPDPPEADRGPVDQRRMDRPPVSPQPDRRSVDPARRIDPPPVSPEAYRGAVGHAHIGKASVSADADDDGGPVDPARLGRPPEPPEADRGPVDQRRMDRPPDSPEADRGAVGHADIGKASVSAEADGGPVDQARIGRSHVSYAADPARCIDPPTGLPDANPARRTDQPPESPGADRGPLARAIAANSRAAIDREAAAFITAVEHGSENASDYDWFASLRREHDLAVGSDNPSVRVRGVLAELAGLVRTDWDFHLRDLGGNTVSLREQHGKTVLLVFWATWCAPCQEELPVLERLSADGNGLTVFAITDEPGDVVKEFVHRRGYSFTVLLDPNREAFRLFDADTLPAAIVIDPTNRIRARLGRIFPRQFVIMKQLAYPE